MNPETYLAPHTLRAADLRAEADAHRLAQSAKRPPKDLRTRVGWTLVEVGLRLASTPPRPRIA
ncbi:hypothetical protein [Streptomyces turgidiscabies]|jgi:hypothetical protein|uniref:Transposase n=1 Tax=Streptomyces turgidiscabies TaxID=85558 RepID=A0ABU0RES4_9ACTN|nr:hypothetical protein [Streptomyces turgidiscabies]MDQ0930464.1 hypothetical protein [Streptomyces turgidiscabies]